MAIATKTLTLPVRAAALQPTPCPEWRHDWRFEAEAFIRSLGPRQGVHRLTLDPEAATVTVDYDPEVFSLNQFKAFGREMGLVVGGSVYHTVMDLPVCGYRRGLALELQSRLQRATGVAFAAINPAARTLTVEYLSSVKDVPLGITRQLRALGYGTREAHEPKTWWDSHQLAIYSAVCAVALAGGVWFEHTGSAPAWLWGALYVIAYLAGGGVAAVTSFNSLRHRRIDVDFLMVAAALGAAAIGDWAEGGMLLFLFSLSNALQHYAMARTRQAIRALMDLRPATARRHHDGEVEIVPVEALEVGDSLEVWPGERLPVDGTIRAGHSALDQSPITGESMPVPRAPGERVLAGSINGGGALEVRVDKRAQDSALARMIALVERAQSERAPTQKRLDAFEQGYASLIVGLTVVTALALPLLFGWPWGAAFYRAMTVMVVASPCALIISTPASLLSAIATGARNGVLFKGGAHLERLADVQVVAFDKTGTLTLGRPRVTDVLVLAADSSEAGLLAQAAAVEAQSEHPLARAIIAAGRERGLAWPEASDLQAAPGQGISARLEGRLIHIGTAHHLRANSVDLSTAVLQRQAELEAQGKTVVLIGASAVARDCPGQLLGLIGIADTLRPEAAPALAALRSVGIARTVMLTGDNARAAQSIGAQAGVDEVRAELMPEDKVAAIKQLQAQYGSVAMVGDGVNDAPALASASIGIAMGAGGTDAALETADVVLMASDLGQLAYAVGLSRQAMRVVKQNLAFALAVIVLLIASAYIGWVALSFGVVGHEGSTVLVVLNGLRLLGFRSGPASRTH